MVKDRPCKFPVWTLSTYIMAFLAAHARVVVAVLPGRIIDLSTTRLTMIAAAGLAQYDALPQIAE